MKSSTRGLLTAYLAVSVLGAIGSLLLAQGGRLLLTRELPRPYGALPIDRPFLYFVPLVSPAMAWVAARERRASIMLVAAAVASLVWAMARLLYGWSVAERAMDDLAVGGQGLATEGPWLEGLTVVSLGLVTIALFAAGVVWSVWSAERRGERIS